LSTIYSTIDAIEENVIGADLVIGGVLLPGAAAPKLISEKLVRQMKKGSVLVDVAIDQGGCFETSHATTHADPTYMVHDVVHYASPTCRAPWRARPPFALNNATLPFTIALAELGADAAMKKNPHLRAGLNVYKHTLTYQAVADAQTSAVQSAEAVLGI
jgi:alanine dehydrogenase